MWNFLRSRIYKILLLLVKFILYIFVFSLKVKIYRRPSIRAASHRQHDIHHFYF